MHTVDIPVVRAIANKKAETVAVMGSWANPLYIEKVKVKPAS